MCVLLNILEIQVYTCCFVVLTSAQGVFHFSVLKEQTQWLFLVFFLLSWYFKSGWMSLIYKAFCFYNRIHTYIHVTVMRKATYIIWSLMQIDKTHTSNRSYSHTRARTHTFLLLLCQTNIMGCTLIRIFFFHPSIYTAHAPNKSRSFDISCSRACVWLFSSVDVSHTCVISYVWF